MHGAQSLARAKYGGAKGKLCKGISRCRVKIRRSGKKGKSVVLEGEEEDRHEIGWG